MKVLVTGSSGFIGKHTLRALIANDHEVRTFDLSAGRDIRDEEQIQKLIRGVDVVMHFAALIDVLYSLKHPVEFSEVNITGTIKILEACRKYDVKKFIFGSSLLAYGQPKELPVKEQHPPKPITPYGLTKLVGEQYARLYGDIYGINTVSLRYSNVYGIGQKRGLIADCLNAVKRNKSFFIYGDGKQTRDFVHVRDVVQANLLTLKRGVNDIFNIGSGVETSVSQVVRIFQELTGNRSLIHKPTRIAEVKRIYADIGKAKRKLSYRPKVSLKEGLRGLINVAG